MHLAFEAAYKSYRSTSILATFLLGISIVPGFGQPEIGQAEEPGATFADSLSLTSRKEPIHIRSEDLEFFYGKNRIEYRGNVVVTQGDMTLRSDFLTVFYDDQASVPRSPKTSPPQRIKRIVAEGNVEITSGERLATSRKAVFNEKKRTVTLQGNAILREGTNQVAGDVVEVFLDEKRSIVKGGKGKRRAQMLLIPDEQ